MNEAVIKARSIVDATLNEETAPREDLLLL
jgi:hypothetical protein